MRFFDYLITFLIIFLAIFYLYKLLKKKKSSPTACLGCPYANEGGCSLHKKDKENCDISKLK